MSQIVAIHIVILFQIVQSVHFFSGTHGMATITMFNYSLSIRLIYLMYYVILILELYIVSLSNS